MLVLIVVWTYRRERFVDGAVGRRWLLVVLPAVRMALLGLLVVMACQPLLVLQRTRTEPAVVAVMVDSSASMSVPDEEDQTSRFQRAIDLVSADQGQWLQQLLARNEVAFFGYDTTAGMWAEMREAADIPDALVRLAEQVPRGQASDLSSSISSVFEHLRGRRVAGVVIMGDGRQNLPQQISEVVEKARARNLALYTVALGNSNPPPDPQIESLSADQVVFINDLVPVRASVSAGSIQAPLELTLQLMRKDQASPLHEQTVTLTPDRPRETVELRFRPESTGLETMHVRVIPLERELTVDNNLATTQIHVKDQRIRVLYADGYPRWEYRYLKNHLVREPTVMLSCLLFSADENFAQEGNKPITRFPVSEEELFEYDVLLLGDIDPVLLTEAQQRMVERFVSNRGGGLAFLAGPKHCPDEWAGTTLQKLLPVTLSIETARNSLASDSPLMSGFSPQMTPEGSISDLFRFAADLQESINIYQSLPPLFWYAATGESKPATQVLLTLPQRDSQSVPLMVSGHYGAGQTFYLGVDSTWRWRYYQGEPYFDTFWVQMIRSLARQQLLAQDRRAVLRTDRTVYQFDERVNMELRIFDRQLILQLPDSLPVAVYSDQSQTLDNIVIERSLEDPSLYRKSIVPRATGPMTAQAALPSASTEQQRPTAHFSVTVPQLEMQNLAADKTLLHELAAQTQGRMILANQISELVPLIPSRGKRIADDLTEPLWDTPLILWSLIGLIAAEWTLRKVGGLL